MARKKNIERICNNCRLYDSGRGVCSVIVLHEGEKLNVPMDPQDSCLYEIEYFDPTTKAIESFSEDIKEVKMWVENSKGEKVAGEGIVKIEYPEGFLGEGEELHDIIVPNQDTNMKRP